VRDLLEEELSSCDTIDDGQQVASPYQEGDPVMLRAPDRQQKLLRPYEAGWEIRKILSPTTVVIQRTADHRRQKVVNVDVLKLSPADSNLPGDAAEEPGEELELAVDGQEDVGLELELSPSAGPIATGGAGGYSLRNRATLEPPRRYRDGE